MFHVSRQWRLFLLVPVLMLEAWAQAPTRTTISDSVYRADGNAAEGTLLISWPAFTTSGGQPVAPGTTSVTLGSGGALSVALVPNQGATPVNTVYTVVYQLSDIVKTEYWSVPTTSPTNLATVRVTLGASSAVSQMVTQQYVEAAVAGKANDSSVVHLSGSETITGVKQFSAAPSFPTPVQANAAANKAYVDSSVQNVGGGGPYVSTAGGTMSGPLTLSGDPAAPNQAANKHYVDSWAAVKADLISGLVPPAELASGSPGAGTCLLGNQTWGSCGGGGSSSINSTQVASPNFNSTAPAAQSSFLNCSFRNTGSNVSLECPYGNTSSSFALGSQAVLNNQANSYGSELQDFNSASLKLPAGASYAPSLSGAIGFDTTANMPVINVNGTTQQIALTTSNISGQASAALALAATPAQCNGSFATGIQANGNANCSTADVVQLAETAQPSGISNFGIFWFDSTTHTPRVIDNNGQVAQLGLMNAFNSDANTLEEYNGSNPQTLNIYGTRADTSNYERMRLGYDTTDGYFFLSAEAAGTGTQRGLGFWMQGGLRWVLDSSFNLKPWSDNVKDIGSPALRPKHLYAGTYADLTGGALVTEIANQTATGTTLNKLAKVTGSPVTAIIASTSDTSGVIGVVADGAGTTGNAQIARGGQAACVFDGPTTAGDYVQISSTTAGDCHDAGASYPGTGQVLGRVLSTNGAGGTYSVLVSGGDLQANNVGGSPAGTAGYILTGTGSSSSFSPQALDATQLSGADPCAKMKSAVETTINGTSSPVVSGLGFINSSIACADPPFTSTDLGVIQLPPGLIAAQNTWLFGPGMWLHGTARASGTTGAKGTLIQAQNAGSGNVANPVLQMGNATTGNIFGSGADWITLDGNSLAGTIGLQDDYLQEEGGFDRLKTINATVVGDDFGLGASSIQHGVNLTNSEISASSAEGASCGPAVNGLAISAVSVNTSGVVAATVASTANLFTRNQAVIAGVPAGTSHGTNFNGFYEITVASGTTFTYTINVILADSAGGGGSISTYTLPLRVWTANTTVRPIRNVTISGTNCTNAFPATWAGAEFSGKGPILVETLHVEGYPIGIDIGGLAGTAGVDLEQADLESGSVTNCLVTGVQISNQFGAPTDIKIHNLEGTGAGTCGNPTNTIVDLANGNTITYAHNKRVSQYDLDGTGFPHALLANCADVTNGWCDDGNFNSLWVGGTKLWSVKDSNGAATAATPTAGDNSTNVATTAFVASSFAPLASPSFTGTPTAPTPCGGDSSTKLATTAYVQNQTTGIPWLTVGRAGSVSGVTFSTTANQAELWGVVLTYPVTTSQVTYYVGTVDNTTNSYDIGIYNSSGALVVHTGSKAGTVFAPALGATTLSWAASATLQPGKYYLAITTNCTASCAAIDGDNASAVSFLSKGVVSVSAGGALNSSLTPPADAWSYSSITPAWAVR
ncbi:MAG: hypothetical protein WB952_24715 [Terriglobales bacterium]